ISRVLAPISWARASPASKASYSAWLLEIGNSYRMDCSIMIPSGFSRMIPAPPDFWVDDPSTCNFQLGHRLCFDGRPRSELDVELR
ncbi:hypothetical protein PIB30_113451, partial [Stylosanthes scabra]|nr:hypothetical protein [Stylosanthes scabra]